MKINGKNIDGKKFAYDGCHKIYVIEDKKDEKEAIDLCYSILNIKKLPETYYKSCPLRFISNWKLTKKYVEQCKKLTKFSD